MGFFKFTYPNTYWRGGTRCIDDTHVRSTLSFRGWREDKPEGFWVLIIRDKGTDECLHYEELGTDKAEAEAAQDLKTQIAQTRKELGS